MHVRITEKGREILNNKELANKVVDSIIKNEKELAKGETIKVENPDHAIISVSLVTSITDQHGHPNRDKRKD